MTILYNVKFEAFLVPGSSAFKISSMSDLEDTGPEYRWYADRAKTGRSGCKKCKQKIESGALRMAKAVPSPFGSGGLMKSWHHLDCMFEVFAKQRATTAKIESVDDIGDWNLLSKEDQEEILKRFPNPDSIRKSKNGGLAQKEDQPSTTSPSESSAKTSVTDPKHKDNSFREFRRLCSNIANVSGYLEKTAVVKKFLTGGTDGDSFKGDALLVVKLLLPGVIKRVYNLQSKQIVKLFSRILGTDHDEMLESLEQGDVAETVGQFFDSSRKVKPAKKSLLTLQDVDSFLERLTKLTREEDQIGHFSSIVQKCTSNDLKLIIRLIKHDLRFNAGAKHILDAVHDDAYQAFQASRDLNSIINKLKTSGNSPSSSSKKKENGIAIDLSLLTPVLPMLAQACKSVEDAMKRCPNGMYSEIKYDGERVQVHKQGDVFKFYSRSLKPVLPHKVKPLIEFIPKAFPHAKDLILDSEILMIDNQTGDPLPFGSLGVHKKNDYKNANVCLFVFDCMFYNGRSLLTVPLRERKKILRENMTEIPFRVVFSEMKEIHDPKDLGDMITQVIRKGLEGLVLKDIKSVYEPGKRHWLKVKKDYLHDGAMADSADLVVLGAWFGTGRKGGLMSVFLMGCYDEDSKVWRTVTKVHGHDDKTLAKLQDDLEMIKIGKDADLVPSWLNCTKSMVPDFIAVDPKKQPVWEITGAEFTKHVVHTADGISVRFPRVKRARDDKTWETATTLKQLKAIYKKSKETSDFSLGDVSPSVSPSKKKRPATSSKADGEPSPKKTKYELENPFPDLFDGMTIVVPTFLKRNEARKLERYFIAYGGDVLRPEDADSCTHRLVEKNPRRGNEVDIEEIWQCIKNQRKPNI